MGSKKLHSKELNPSKMDIILKGLELNYKKLILGKRRNNKPVIIFKNGIVMAVNPFEMPE